jgi:hypothetical protein
MAVCCPSPRQKGLAAWEKVAIFLIGGGFPSLIFGAMPGAAAGAVVGLVG